MNYRFLWKEISDDGLLKDPPDMGDAYSKVDFNLNLDTYIIGFKSEQEAVAHFEKWRSEDEWACPRELVLIKVYSTYKFD